MPSQAQETSQGQTSVEQEQKSQEQQSYQETKAILRKVMKMLKLRRYDEAMSLLERVSQEKGDVLKKSKKLSFYWNKLIAIAFERKKQLVRAIDFYKKAVEINSKDVYSTAKLSIISFKLKRRTDAKKYLNDALKIAPNNKKVIALKRKIEELEAAASGWQNVFWEAGLLGGGGLPFHSNLSTSTGGDVFFRFSPVTSIYIGPSFGLYYSFAPTVRINLEGVPADANYNILFYSGALQLSYSFVMTNEWRILAGASFGYYFGRVNSSIKTPSDQSNNIESFAIKNPMLSGSLSLGWLILPEMSLSINAKYIGYLDGENGFDRAIHFVNFGLGVSYVY